MPCRKSGECDRGQVCDRQDKTCRARKRWSSEEDLAQRCIEKGIPVLFERGPRKGEPKTRPALRRCARQKDRLNTFVSIKSPTSTFVTPRSTTTPERTPVASPFVRPKERELQKMTKAELTRIYEKGQKMGFIDPAKPANDYVNRQLVNAIVRATKPKYL